MNSPSLFRLVLSALLCASFIDISAQDSLSRPVFLLGGVKSGRSLSLSPGKMEAGCALALHLTGRYALLPASQADSVVRYLTALYGGTDTLGAVTNQRVAAAIGARGILFVRFDRLQNIIRAEVRIATDSGYARVSTGRGFALVRYRSEKLNDVVSDPAMLTALQRALCVALGDSSLYDACEGVYRVKPAPTLVPGGMVFSSDGSHAPWIVFDKHTVAAYDAVVNVFDTLKNSSEVVCYDIDSRDSVFALFRLHLIENDQAPNATELDALHRLEVEYYVTGTCTRTAEGAEMSLSLARIRPGGSYAVLRTVKTVLREDTIVSFRAAVRSLATRLVREQFGGNP
ncbi:MAG: hypothetical protein ACKOBV_04145 [Candidatus Kapaibacterium sp.]